MYLKKPAWAPPDGDGDGGDPSPPSPAVAELVSSLNKERVKREVTLALRSGLRDAKAEFSFLRVRGLRSILKFLRSVAESDATIRIFCSTQSIPQLQVVPVLFQNTLRPSKNEPVLKWDHIFSVEPMHITGPATDTEVALALRVLEGSILYRCYVVHVSRTIYILG
ncbi:hypothetical protein ACLOJK_001344 [Asimina triloba]